MDHQALLSYFQRKQPEMLATIRQLVELETPSDDKPRLDAFAQMLAQRFQDVGAAVEVIANEVRGNHLRVMFDDPAHVTDVEAKPALILCHFDTVWPVGSLETHPFRVDESGRAYGPGIFDMQSSLVLAEYLVRGVRDLDLHLPRPVVLLATSDEEVGSHTSRLLIETDARAAAYVLVMESPLPGGVLKTSRKGSGNFKLTVTGRAAHAGVEPEKGISAIQELAHQILRIHGLSNWEKGTTLNVGVISGGTRPNVVAASAEALIDLRVWTQRELDRITKTMSSLQPVMEGVTLKVEGGENRPPLERTVTKELFAQAQVIGQQLGLQLGEGSTGGGSDGNLTGALGIPTLDGLGVPGHGAHADHEHIEVDQIAGRAALLVALVMELAAR